jgi:beta-glucosidase
MTLPGAALARTRANETYHDSRAPIAARGADLLSRMTLEERAAQLCFIWTSKSKLLDAAGNFSLDKAMKALPHGIGHVSRPGDNTGWSKFLDEPTRTIEGTVAFVIAFRRFI